MTTFEQRLANIEKIRGTGEAAPLWTLERAQGTSGKSKSIPPFLLFIMLPFAIALGAATVIAGGVIEVAVLGNSLLNTASFVPPPLGPSAFGMVLLLCFFVARLFRSDHIGPIAVALGFVGMLWGEGRLAEAYPELWAQIYQADYLLVAIDTLGLSEMLLA